MHLDVVCRGTETFYITIIKHIYLSRLFLLLQSSSKHNKINEHDKEVAKVLRKHSIQ
jgi:hypothetical protein